ncbi:MAG: hypothetical protein ACI4LX_06490 [Treponema sp.]
MLPLILISLLCTSCIDCVQSVTYKDGKYQMYYKVTFSKLLFELAEEDPEEILELLDKDDFPKNANVKPVNTDLEVGAEFSFSIDPKTTDETEKAFLPTVSGQKYFFTFLAGEENDLMTDSMKSDSEMQEITEAVLSSAKCRVIISKKIISSIDTAYFEGRAGQNYSIPVFDYGETYCLEIPFIVLFESSMYKLDKIVIVKNT